MRDRLSTFLLLLALCLTALGLWLSGDSTVAVAEHPLTTDDPARVGPAAPGEARAEAEGIADRAWPTWARDTWQNEL